MSKSKEPPGVACANTSRQQLTPARQTLLRLMQELNFGQFIGLVVHDGEPVCEPLPRRAREHKFRGDNGPRQERDIVDFTLKSEVVELFAYFDTVRNVRIDLLEVKYGLPFRMVVTEDAA